MDDCKITETETVMENGSISVHATCENAVVRTEMTYIVNAAELRECREPEGALALAVRRARIHSELREAVRAAVRAASAPAIVVLAETIQVRTSEPEMPAPGVEHTLERSEHETIEMFRARVEVASGFAWPDLDPMAAFATWRTFASPAPKLPE